MNTRKQSLSHAGGPRDVPLLDLTIGAVLERTAAVYPERDALVVVPEGVRMRWGEFLEQVDRVARGLMAMGVGKGHRVAIWATNRSQWVLTQFATARIGAILVNINPGYGSRELHYALEQSETQTLIMIRGFGQVDYLEMISEICPEAVGAGAEDWRSGGLPHLRNLILAGDGQPLGGMGSWDELVSGGQAVDSVRVTGESETSLNPQDPINIQYTSGTTGYPKGAVLTHRNIVNNALLVGQRMRLTCRDRVCIPVPFYHCFGMVLGNMACAVHGAAMVIPAESFDPWTTLKTIEEEGCTAVYGVPTMFIRELEHPEFPSVDLGTLRTGIMAGSPCPIELMKQVVEKMHCREITIAYGLTESSPVITQTGVGDPLQTRVTTVGRPLPHTEVKIIDPGSGEVVPRGNPGELCTRGYLVMNGYYRNPKATREAIDSEGWLHTGDLATLDEEDYCRITGRVKDMIIRGGENIYPREIEEFLYTHPAVSDVQVVGVPDLRMGEEVLAWIRLKEKGMATARDIRDFCRGKISKYKIPRYIKFVDSYPMTITGKIQKYKIRDIAIRELGLGDISNTPTA